MDIVTANLSFPFQTGNAVLDVLLENKAALAANKGITVSSTLKVPFPCSVGDMDFCIILSNALDNAIHACEKLGMDEKSISAYQVAAGGFFADRDRKQLQWQPPFQTGYWSFKYQVGNRKVWWGCGHQH